MPLKCALEALDQMFQPQCAIRGALWWLRGAERDVTSGQAVSEADSQLHYNNTFEEDLTAEEKAKILKEKKVVLPTVCMLHLCHFVGCK